MSVNNGMRHRTNDVTSSTISSEIRYEIEMSDEVTALIQSGMRLVACILSDCAENVVLPKIDWSLRRENLEELEEKRDKRQRKQTSQPVPNHKKDLEEAL